MEINVTEENYDELREELLEKNENFIGIVLREKEKEVDRILEKLKTDFLSEFGTSDVFEIPVLDNEKIVNSPLYKFCSVIPKGGDLHVHDMALLPAKELISLLCEIPEFYINGDRKSYDLIYVKSEEIPKENYLPFGTAIKENYYSKEEIIRNWTVLNAGKNEDIWQYFEGLFDKHAPLSSNPDFAEKYYERAFLYYCEKNIMHVEIHIMLTDSLDESEEYINRVKKAYYKVKEKYPHFTVKMIGAGVKADSDNAEFTKKCFLNASFVQETVKDDFCGEEKNFLIGFDLVNEEDRAMPLKAFAPMLLKVKKRFPDMKLYIHGGESINSSNENLIDAYLLGVSRVGHGLNLYRYPDLHLRYKEREICLEVCPVSNQRLGYVKDVRNHPATEYLRSGVPISLCSDDPSYMENETLTDDFFAGVISWNLNLADIKQLALNSLMYSGLEGKEKSEAVKNFGKKWNEFIDGQIG